MESSLAVSAPSTAVGQSPDCSASPMPPAPAAVSPMHASVSTSALSAASSPASSSGNEEVEKLPLPDVDASRSAPVVNPTDPASEDDEGDSPTATGSGSGGLAWGSTAFGMVKNRAVNAKKTLAPQLLSMRDRTSKQFEKYQPTIVKAKSSASAAASVGLHRVKEGSTQGWSMFKSKLAYAAPVADRLQTMGTMGLNVVTDMMGDISVEELLHVDDPRRANCHFLESYKPSTVSRDSSERASTIFRLSRAVSSASNSSVHSSSVDGSGDRNAAEQCLATPYVLGTILLFCGDLQDVARVSCVNRACLNFISSERRIGRFCVRYGRLPNSLRFGFWEHTSRVAAVRKATELDFDTYLHMGLSKGDSTELIHTDVRRTYGRVAPHKRVAKANAGEEPPAVVEERLVKQLSDVLHALDGRFPDVGYCQGMDYIAAHVLNKVKASGKGQGDADVEAELTFWLLVTLFERFGLREMFAPGLQTLHVHCFQTQRLLELAQPELAVHLEKEKVPIEMFAVGWFQTLFLYLNVLPTKSLDRVWDIFLFEKNWKVLLRVAVALMQLSEQYVMERPIDDIMQFFNTFAGKADELLAEEALLERALGLKVTNSVLNKLQKQYTRHKRSPTRN